MPPYHFKIKSVSLFSKDISQIKFWLSIEKHLQKKKQNVGFLYLNPFSPTCGTFLAELYNPVTHQAIELESCSNLLWIQKSSSLHLKKIFLFWIFCE